MGGKSLEEILKDNGEEVTSSQMDEDDDIISEIKKALTKPQLKTVKEKKDKAGKGIEESKKQATFEDDEEEHFRKTKSFDIQSMMTATNQQSQYKCNIRGKEGRSTSIQYHIESEHADKAEEPSRNEISQNTLNTTESKETIPETTFVAIDGKSLEQLQETFPCILCERKMKTKKALRCHIKNQHKTFTKSIETQILETTKEATKLDIKKTVEPQLEVKENMFACHLCDKAYKVKGSLKKHVTRNHKSYAEVEEGPTNNSEEEMVLEIEMEDDNIENQENEKIDNKINLDEKESDILKGNQIQEEEVDVTGDATEEEENTYEDDTLSEVNEEFLCYYCDQCDHRTDSEESLSEHKQTEHAKLRCKKCNTELKNKGNFRRHYQYKHSEVSLDEFKELFYKVV